MRTRAPSGTSSPRAEAPTLALLCQWHKIMHQAVSEMDQAADGQTVYVNNMGDVKALPQIATIKTASAEIRQLNKLPGAGEGEGEAVAGNVLTLISGKRKDRRARAEG